MTLKKISKFRWIIFFISLFILVFSKLYSFNNLILNVDEIEWIYCLNRCYENPIPFLGFDAHTTGPLAIYFLLPLKMVINNVELMHLRIYNFLVFIVPSLFIVYKVFEGKYSYLSLFIFSSLFLIYNKDFLSYNSEYPIILLVSLFIYFLTRSVISNVKITILVSIIILLPFIKFQAILLSLFFLGIFFWKLYLQKKRLIKYSLILFLCWILVLGILIKFFIGFELFFYSYILRNIQYAASFSSKSWSVAIIENLNYHIQFFLPYYILIFGIAILIFIKYYKRIISFIKEYNSIEQFNFITFLGLFIVSFISILIPKNNFVHYFIIMFPAIVFLLVFLLKNFDISSGNLIILICLLNTNLFQFIFQSQQDVFIKGNQKSRLFYEQYTISSKLVKEVNNQVCSGNIKKSLVILGWFNALPIYYKYKHQFDFPYRSGHADFLVSSSYLSDKKFFNFEMDNLVSDLKNGKTAIIDVENVLTKIKSKRFKLYLHENFHVVKETEFYTLLLPKN